MSLPPPTPLRDSLHVMCISANRYDNAKYSKFHSRVKLSYFAIRAVPPLTLPPKPPHTFPFQQCFHHRNCRLLQRHFRDISLPVLSRKYPCGGWQLRWRPYWTRIMRSFPQIIIHFQYVPAIVQDLSFHRQVNAE